MTLAMGVALQIASLKHEGLDGEAGTFIYTRDSKLCETDPHVGQKTVQAHRII